MANQQNAVAVAAETIEQKIARFEAENKALKAEKKEQDSAVPMAIDFGMSVEGKGMGSLTAIPTTFSTGSQGFRGFGKATIKGVAYQVQVQAVRIHSKPTK